MFTVLGVRRSGDVGELKKFFNGGEYGLYQVLRIVDRLLDDVFALEELVGHQPTVVVLKVSQHVHDGVVDRIGRAIADIIEVRLFEYVINLMHKSLLESRHLSEQTHSLGMCDPHVGIHVGGCAVRDDEWNRVSQVDKGSGWDE